MSHPFFMGIENILAVRRDEIKKPFQGYGMAF